jgi:hypothetical protein
VRFHEFARSRVCKRLTKEEQCAFMSICHLIGNDELTFMLLGYPTANTTDGSGSEESGAIARTDFAISAKKRLTHF